MLNGKTGKCSRNVRGQFTVSLLRSGGRKLRSSVNYWFSCRVEAHNIILLPSVVSSDSDITQQLSSRSCNYC